MSLDFEPDKRHAAVCGLFCPACVLFIATQDGPEALKRLAERWNRPLESLECQGCRADIRSEHCRSCTFVQCAADKGWDFCGECADYPCEELRVFQAERPHRLELWESLARIGDVGYEQWLSEMKAHFSCPDCGTINSAYHPVCRNCGKEPGSEYVRRHRETIAAFSKRT